MPTDKPYLVSVRVKEHDRPTRRVPPEGTFTATDGAVVVLLDGDDNNCDDIRVVEALRGKIEKARYRRLMTTWLGVGRYFSKVIAEDCEANPKLKESVYALFALMINNMVDEALIHIDDPETLVARLAIQEFAGKFVQELEKRTVVEATEPTRKFGTN